VPEVGTFSEQVWGDSVERHQAQLGFEGEISRKGVPAPIQVGKRWVVERTHSWMNGYAKLRRCPDKNSDIVDFFLYLAAALVTVRQLIAALGFVDIEVQDRHDWYLQGGHG
jgi:hypothetical protein